MIFSCLKEEEVFQSKLTWKPKICNIVGASIFGNDEEIPPFLSQWFKFKVDVFKIVIVL